MTVLTSEVKKVDTEIKEEFDGKAEVLIPSETKIEMEIQQAYNNDEVVQELENSNFLY